MHLLSALPQRPKGRLPAAGRSTLTCQLTANADGRWPLAPFGGQIRQHPTVMTPRAPRRPHARPRAAAAAALQRYAVCALVYAIYSCIYFSTHKFR